MLLDLFCCRHFSRYISFLVCNSTTQHFSVNNSSPENHRPNESMTRPPTWQKSPCHAVRKKPGRNGVVWSGQALEECKQRKREEMLELLRKARAFEAEK
jgi:hypothetical protein